MGKGRILKFVVLVSFIINAEGVCAQEFGRNKPHYHTFKFKVTKSPHFALYHYLKEDGVAETFLGTAERWYNYERLQNPF